MIEVTEIKEVNEEPTNNESSVENCLHVVTFILRDKLTVGVPVDVTGDKDVREFVDKVTDAIAKTDNLIITLKGTDNRLYQIKNSEVVTIVYE